MRRLIRRRVADGLSQAEEQRLREHLRTCRDCRDEHDRLAEVLRGAAGQPQTRSEVARLRAALLAPRPSAPSRRAGWQRLAPFLGAGLLAATASLLLVFRPQLPEPEVQLRGGKAAPVVDLQVFAIREERAGEPVRTRLLKDGDELRLDELVQFRYLSTDPRQRYLYLLGVDERLQPIDYFPRPTETRSIAIQPTLRMEPAPRSIRLAKRHSSGRLWVYALFSPRPIERQEVHRTLERLRMTGVRAENMGKIDWGKDVLPVLRRFAVKHEAE